MSKFLLFLPLIALAFLPVYLIFLKSPPPLPELDHNAWWGSGSRDKVDESIKPFTVKFSDLSVKDLKDRLRTRRPFPPPLEGVGFEYGFNTNVMDTWLQYWFKNYNFTERAEFFNQYPHFKTKIQGLDIHFMRVTPEVPKGVEVVPMLMLHGWPGSIREFYEAIPHLTAVSKDRDFAIELIIPSLPGYGFSEGAVRPGMGPPEIALILRNLMHRIGFQKFYVQGGDWGSVIGSNMATFFPEEVLGYHTNMPVLMTPAVTFFSLLGSIYPPMVVDSHLVDRMYPLTDHYSNLIEETGYMHLQATKPDTIGVALKDSPSGLLAYILEKFSTWTAMEHRSKVDGNLEFHFTKEQLLDNIMVYWSTRSITTSMRLYAECFNKRYFGMKLDEIPSPVPTWAIQAKHEISYIPAWMFRLKFHNLLETTVLDGGGHFLAFELPEVFSKDVLKAVQGFREWRRKNVKTEL